MKRRVWVSTTPPTDNTYNKIMPLTNLQLTNFRSYTDRTIELDPVATLVVGPNATGKTNLLEALFVLATTKSFRAKDAELVYHGEDFYRLAARQDETELALGYQITEGGTEKRARHNGVARSLSEHLGTLRVVLFEPNDLLVVFGPPDRRRRYLNFILTQTDTEFVKILANYRRILQQRNRLLGDWQGQTNELFAWNLQLADQAAEIDRRRRDLITHINTLATEHYAAIAGSSAPLELRYQGVVDGAAEYATGFLQRLEDSLHRDIAAGFTTIGPHRDAFALIFKEADIASVASRGEVRTAVLALKLAELSYIEGHTGSKPLLLLDDVFSELDDARRRYLLKTLGAHQSLITTTNADVAAELTAQHTTIHTELPKAVKSKAKKRS